MFATFNSRARAGKPGRQPGFRAIFRLCAALALAAGGAPVASAPGVIPASGAPEKAEGAPSDPAAAAKQEFERARADMARDDSRENIERFIRVAFDWADMADNDRTREEVALEGIAAARRLAAREPESAAAYYYLGMNLGQLARTKLLAGLRIVAEMETVFETSRRLDATFDFGGPDRNLGLLYLQAPGWPLSVGDRRKARVHLERALKLSPEHPENWLNLIEARLKWGERAVGKKEYDRMAGIWNRAKETLSDPKWAREWKGWEQRREEIRKTLEQ